VSPSRTFTEEHVRAVLRRQLERWRLMRTSDPEKSQAQVAAYQEIAVQLLGRPIVVEDPMRATQ
jgi:arsenate reductase-like glutaredoxin family protein